MAKKQGTEEQEQSVSNIESESYIEATEVEQKSLDSFIEPGDRVQFGQDGSSTDLG